MLLDDLKHHAETEKPGDFIKRIVRETGYQAMLDSLPDAEAKDRTENVLELISAAHIFEDDHPGDSNMRKFLEEATLSSAVDRWDDDQGSITLMTMHAAKGLEFPVVFIVGLEEGILPHHRAKEKPDEMEEERRLLFVGITRAQKSPLKESMPPLAEADQVDNGRTTTNVPPNGVANPRSHQAVIREPHATHIHPFPSRRCPKPALES